VSREPDERDGRTRRNARRRCTVSSPFATHESRPGFSALSTQTQQQPGGGSWLGHRVGKLWGEVTGPPRAAASQGATGKADWGGPALTGRLHRAMWLPPLRTYYPNGQPCCDQAHALGRSLRTKRDERRGLARHLTARRRDLHLRHPASGGLTPARSADRGSIQPDTPAPRNDPSV
jgi:hypothetical protein